ncbi:DNA replication/repair protein RecF [Pseudokineococcus sp. 5B2Z-1]|uniref:DNA replication/repair protein RecF n=1 Tax=Pseudokineococcus sp. 5B2Z-1 TaxID=3132744 RepID=UPI00309CB220
MHVAHLSLADFRNYERAELPLEPGVTALVGPNGQGKTNLVEALGYVASLSSHRVANDAPLVRAGAERAVVRASVVRDGRPLLAEVEINPGRANRARLGRAALPRARELVGTLRTVLFAPEDLALVKGDPEGRRRFADDLLVLLAPRLAGVRAEYDRALKQRNALLRSAGATSAARRGAGPLPGIEVWDHQLAALGADLLSARRYLLARLAPYVARAYDAVAETAPGGTGAGAAAEGGLADVVRLAYRGSLAEHRGEGEEDLSSEAAREAGAAPRDVLAAQLVEAMEQLRRREVERGLTLVGPHRDDVLLSLRGLPARGYASHGESWSYALALRLGAYELLRSEGPGTPSEREPVLVLDDVFAELDARRRSRLAELVAGAEQVLLTAAVPEDVPPQLTGRRVHVRAGALQLPPDGGPAEDAVADGGQTDEGSAPEEAAQEGSTDEGSAVEGSPGGRDGRG